MLEACPAHLQHAVELAILVVIVHQVVHKELTTTSSDSLPAVRLSRILLHEHLETQRVEHAGLTNDVFARQVVLFLAILLERLHGGSSLAWRHSVRPMRTKWIHDALLISFDQKSLQNFVATLLKVIEQLLLYGITHVITLLCHSGLLHRRVLLRLRHNCHDRLLALLLLDLIRQEVADARV